MKREIKIGLTGIVALVILFLGINFLKGVSLFNPSHYYYIIFRNAKGLSKSSTVYADGFDIGIVSDVKYERPGRVAVEICVNDGVKIPRGTKAVLEEGMLGGCTLNMTMGCNPADCFAPGDSIEGSDANGLMAAAADVVPQVETVLAHVDSLILTLNKLANDPNLAQILQNTAQTTANLNESTEQLNKLLHNDIPQLTASFNAAGENAVVFTDQLAKIELQKTLDKVNETLENVQHASQKLSSPDNNVGLLLSDTALYGNLTHTLGSATLLLEDLKANPKRYINVSVFGRKNKE